MFSSTRFSKARFRPLASIALTVSVHAGLHAAVVPPPLPPGSAMVEVEGGLSKDERKRHVRAHSHKFRHKKDPTRDDTVHGDPESTTHQEDKRNGNGNGNGNGPRNKPENTKEKK